MNFINIIIIGGTLIVLIIVIMIITRSLKNVDEKIVEELKANDKDNNIGFFSRLKSWGISFFELIIKKTKKNIQSLHSWIIKEKKKSKNDIIKAKEELIIEDESVGMAEHDDEDGEDSEAEELSAEKQQADVQFSGSEREKNKNNQREKSNLSIFYNKEKETPVDSLVVEEADEVAVEKSGFMKSLFKKNKQTKKNVDIYNDSSEKWSLGGSDNPVKDDSQVSGGIKITEVGKKFVKNNKKEEDKNLANSVGSVDDNDEMIGVDRKILEKKILQKIDKNPKELNNYKELGDLYIKMEKLEDALEVFEYVLSVNPRDLIAIRKKRKIKLLKRIAK